MSRVIEDKHRRIQFAALCLVSSMIGFAALYAAGFSRFGSGRFIALAIFLLVIVKLVESVVTEPSRTNLDLWYLVYAPTVGDWSCSGLNVSFDQPKCTAKTATIGAKYMILHRYFANRFLVIFLSVTAIFTLFIGLIAYVEQLRQVGDRADATQVAILTLLIYPQSFIKFFR